MLTNTLAHDILFKEGVISLNHRVKELRNTLGLSRDEFGKILGVSRDVIANIELDRLARPEQKEPLIRLMCEKFNVNPEWIKSGVGEMFIDTSNEQKIIDAYCQKFNIDGDARKIIELYARFTPDQRNKIIEVIKLFASGFDLPSINPNEILYAARTVDGEPAVINHIPDLSSVPDEGEDF